jgi:hypothetical protein
VLFWSATALAQDVKYNYAMGTDSAKYKTYKWMDIPNQGGRRFGGMGTATSSTINIGTLVFDVFDGAAKQQIWTGQATKTIDRATTRRRTSSACRKELRNS